MAKVGKADETGGGRHQGVRPVIQGGDIGKPFGLESWVISDATMKVAEGTHVGFLHHTIRKRERRQADVKWETPRAEELLREAGMQSTAKYIIF